MQGETLRKNRTGITTNKITFAMVLLVSILPFFLKWIGVQERFSSVTGSIITIVVLLICYLINFNKVSTKNNVIILIINIMSLLFSLILNGNFGVATVHINMLLMLFVLNNITFSKEQCLWIHALQAILIFIWLQTLDTELMWKSFVFEPSGLYVNPCTVAIMTLSCFFHSLIVIQSINAKHLFFKFVICVACLMITVSTFNLISETVCRASLLAFCLFFVLFIFKKRVAKQYGFYIKCAVLATMFFPLIYIGLSLVLENFEFFGKSFFTQRDNVWKAVYGLILPSPLFGAGSENDIYLMGKLMDDAHNLFLGIWKNIGLIPMISMAVVFCQGKNIKNVTHENQLSKIAFLSAFLISMVETLLNGSEYYIFYFTFLLTIQETSMGKSDMGV